MVRAVVSWLPAPLRPRALEVLLSGNRLAQEAVGLELLTTKPPLLTTKPPLLTTKPPLLTTKPPLLTVT